MTNITTLRPGEHFMFKNFEWVCLDPNHPDGGLLAIMAEPWGMVALSNMIQRTAFGTEKLTTSATL